MDYESGGQTKLETIKKWTLKYVRNFDQWSNYTVDINAYKRNLACGNLRHREAYNIDPNTTRQLFITTNRDIVHHVGYVLDLIGY